MMHILSFDIGGTKIEANLLYFGDKTYSSSILNFQYHDKDHKIKNAQLLAKKRIPTERQLGYTQIVNKLGKLTKEICEESKILFKNIKGIGLSVPGPVHPQTGEIIMSNSMVMSGHKLHDDLKHALKLKVPVIAENDANCFALAEVLAGSGLNFFKETKIPVHQQTAIGVILGSGCGSGIVKDGIILTGKTGGAGEIGHITLYSGGHPCYCGRQGCAEQYVSGPALEALANSRLYSQIDSRPDTRKIFELYRLKDPIALAVVQQYKKDLAFFLGSVTSVIDPHYFVLGGGMSLEEVIYQNLETDTAHNTFLKTRSIKIYKHKIGDSAGAIGASLIVKQIC